MNLCRTGIQVSAPYHTFAIVHVRIPYGAAHALSECSGTTAQLLATSFSRQTIAPGDGCGKTIGTWPA
jgi:hypothetical protein